MEYKKNSVGNITGNLNQVIQIIFQDGKEIEEKLGVLINRLLKNENKEIDSLKKRITDKENTIKDKSKILDLQENEIIHLKTTLSNKEKQLDESRARFTKTFLDNNGKDFTGSKELYPRALELLTKGCKDEALMILSRHDLLKELDKLNKEKQQQAESWLLRAELLKEKDSFGSLLNECYDIAVNIYPNWDNTIATANHYSEINNYSLALKYYEDSLTKTESDEEKSISLNNYALFLSNQNKPKEALKTYKEVLDLNRKLVKLNEQKYLPHLANTLNNLGVAHISKYEFKKTQKYYKETLNIYQKLAVTDPKTYSFNVATTLTNCASLSYCKDQHKKALNQYKKALKIFRELTHESPEKYMPETSLTLNNLGTLQLELNHYKKAKTSLKDALSIRRKLANKNPEKFLSDVGDSLHNLGFLYEKSKTKKAVKQYLKALGIRKKMAKINPQKHLSKVGMTLFNLGVLHENTSKFEKALLFYQEALEIYKKSAKSNPQKFLPDVAQTLNRLGIIQEEIKDYKNAENFYQKASKTYKKLIKNNPTAFIPKLCVTEVCLSLFYKDSIINKELSIQLSIKALKAIIPYAQTARNHATLQLACKILLEWDVDFEKLINETKYNYLNTNISCPKCEWIPDGKTHWQCTCETIWDTFLSKAKCPKCDKVWEETWCPNCNENSKHLNWY